MNVKKITLWMCICVLLGINCGDPGMLMNGMVTTDGTFVTSVAEFTCDYGYMLVGDTQRVCQPNGNWSNMVPECPRKLLFPDWILYFAFL